MTLYEGLPGTAPNFAALLYMRPWNPGDLEWADLLTRAWTAMDRLLFEERFAELFPQEITWPEPAARPD